MAISKTQNYMVLNYSASPVCVSTKYDSFRIDGSEDGSPGSLPLSFDEIAVINNKSVVFKTGILRFEPEVQEDLYNALSIMNWKDILTQEQIEDTLLNPTLENMQKLLDIENEAYFERVRGAMVALKNSGADVSTKTEKIIERRREEFIKRQRKTSIRLTPKNVEEQKVTHTQEEFDSMKNELAELKAMMAQMLKMSASTETIDASKAAPVEKKQEKTSTNKQKAKSAK